MSAGAVYRYFKSKDDIVTAIATDALAQLSRAFEAAFDPDAPPPLDEVLGVLFGTLEQLNATKGLPRLAVQLWGEAIRSPALSERVVEAIGAARRLFAGLVEAYQRQGMLPQDAPTEQMARVVTGLVAGFIVQLAVLGDVDAAMFRAGFRALFLNSPGDGQIGRA